MEVIKQQKNKTEIDIIVLTYNNITATKNFITYLYKNTRKNFGLILLDNNSTDDTRSYLFDIAKKYNNITLLFSDTNLGIIDGRNVAYYYSQYFDNKAPYIIFLDNDQFVQKDWLESYFNFISQGYDVIGIEAWQLRNDFYPIRKITSINYIFNYVGCGGIFIDNKVINNIGMISDAYINYIDNIQKDFKYPFDPQFNPFYFEDPDFSFRAFFAGYKIGWNNKKVIYHKPHQLLPTQERRVGFLGSWSKFSKKWADKPLPILKNNIE